MTKAIPLTLIAISGMLGLMYLFMLNSGFGYDATLYYVFGEDWIRGELPYAHYVDVKPPGIFLTAALTMIILGKTPYAVHAATLFMNAALATATMLLCRRYLPWTQSLIAAALVLAFGFLTEMTYFLTEQPMAILGVIACALTMEANYRTERRLLWAFVAGLSLGIALLFKAVAILYLPAALFFLAIELNDNKLALRMDGTRAVLMLTMCAGLAIPLITLMLWAESHGILSRMLLLSFWVPLAEYPFHTVFLQPFLVKLGLPIAAWIGIVVVWLSSGKRGDTKRSEWQLAMIAFAAFSLVPLIKSQSSHYLIPALPFMATFAVSAAPQFVSQLGGGVRRSLLVGVAIVVCLVGYSYRHKLAGRLHMPNFSGEERLAAAVTSLTKPGEHALFINGVAKSSSYLYWISGLRPPRHWPFLAIDLYSYCPSVRENGRLVASIQDESTSIVAWSIDAPIFYLPWDLPFPVEEVQSARTILLSRYEPVTELEGVQVAGLWKLKGRLPKQRPLPGGPFSMSQ